MALIDREAATHDALKACARLGAFFLIATAAGYFYRLDLDAAIPRDGSSLVAGRDFLNFWMYGRAAWMPNPGAWYDAETYQRVIALLLGNDYPGQNWSYPPSIMLLAAPFGRANYLPALATWTLLGLVIFIPVAWRHLAGRDAFIAALCAPAAVFCLISGQSSLITAAMLIGIFSTLDRRPLLAGILIGLLTLKPQLGVLFPVMLIASGRWRVFAAASVTALALAAASVALFGIDAWIEFVSRGLPTQNIVLADPAGIATPYYPTVFMNLRGIGMSYQSAMAVQFAAALGAALAVIWAFRRRANADPRRLAALFFACSIAAVPYLLAYDTLALALAALALLAGSTLDRRERLLARLVYWLPLLQIGLGTLHIPGPALIAPAFAAVIVMRMMREDAATRAPALRAA